ncbi:MAG: ATP-dependent helicase HrpB [Actinomycetota bacterium]
MSPSAPDTGLPIETVIDQVAAALAGPGIGVLTAEPGAGKTTVVPLRLLDQPWLGPDQRILVLEPRRVAARAVARRMAALLGEAVGETVGWRTRDDRRISRLTRIEVVTEGILTRRIQSDPGLSGVAAVLFDEFHERSIHADLGLALAIEAREALRDDLRLLVMSATIDAAAVATLVGGSAGPAPIIDCPGRTYPVEIVWRPGNDRRAQRGGSRNPRNRSPRRGQVEQDTAAAVRQVLGRTDQDVLVFLPGMGEIRRTVEALRSTLPDTAPVEILPLYGALSAEEQDAALRSIPGRRRVVVATDVAETSLTVDGVGAVVDAGLARRPRYDPATGLSRLVTVSASKASADQRAGRAGRLGPGIAVRLWSKVEHAARPKHDQPEISQIDLAPLLLESLAWGVPDPTALRLLDPPTDAGITEARAVLEVIGATDADGRITDAGRRMLALPVHPRLAAMLDGVGDGPLAWPAAILAGLMTERDVIGGRPAERPVDLWPRVQSVVDRDHRLPDTDGPAVQTVRRRARELLDRTGGSDGPVHPADLGRALALAYPDRLAKRRTGSSGRYRIRNGMGGELPATDPLANEPMLVVAELAGTKRNVRIARAAAIDALDVELGFAAEVTEREYFGWDDARNDLSLRVERRLGALDFGTNEQPISPGPAVTAALLDRLVATRLEILDWTEAARTLQARAALVADARPELVPTPIADDALVAAAAVVFGPWLDGATGRTDLAALDLVAVLRARLGWDAAAAIDRLAPAALDLPPGPGSAGSRPVPIDYLADPPRISVRAQRVYGLREAPRIVDGTVALAVELLSPADRPIQITSDLGAFWTGSWLPPYRVDTGVTCCFHGPSLSALVCAPTVYVVGNPLLKLTSWCVEIGLLLYVSWVVPWGTSSLVPSGDRVHLGWVFYCAIV